MFSHRLAIAVFLLSISLITANLHFSVPSANNSPFRLPGMPGATVKVTQGNNQGDHIADYESEYAFDFIVGEENFVITATQGGTVIGVEDSSTVQCGDLDLEIAPQSIPLKHCWAYANFVLIANDDGKTAALYVHLLPYSNKVQMPKVTIREHVNQGDPIGLAGTTGWSSGVHLHFQIERLPSSVSQRSQQPLGWWWTNSLPITFSNPEVLAQDVDGIPKTDQRFLVSNPPEKSSTPIIPPIVTPTQPTPVLVPTPTQPPTPTQAIKFGPVVGSWIGPGRAMQINAKGLAGYDGRLYYWCTEYSSPCDTINNGNIQGGLNVTFQISRIVGNTAYGTITSGTGDRNESKNANGQVMPVGSPISVTYIPKDDTLQVSDGWLMCGPNTPHNDPAYISCVNG